MVKFSLVWRRVLAARGEVKAPRGESASCRLYHLKVPLTTKYSSISRHAAAREKATVVRNVSNTIALASR